MKPPGSIATCFAIAGVFAIRSDTRLGEPVPEVDR